MGILCGFAAIWGAGGVLGAGLPVWMAVIPLAISALLLALAARATFAGRSAAEGRRVRRLVMIWSAVEVAAIIVVAQGLAHFRLGDVIVPAIAIIVGLHFVPLAQGIPAPDYYWSAAGMVLAGVIALALSPPLRLEVAAFGSAVILWATAIRVLGRGIKT